jgi:hypothetical protein
MPEPCGWPAASRNTTSISATGTAPPAATLAQVERHHRRQRRRGPVAGNHARPGRCAVRCGLHAACRRGRRGHARQPERGRRAADDGRSGARRCPAAATSPASPTTCEDAAMIRTLHRWPGLLALALVTILALSGAALSVFPAAERLSTPQAEAGLTVADLAGRIQTAYPGVEQIRARPRAGSPPTGSTRARPGAAVIDPATGKGVASPTRTRSNAGSPTFTARCSSAMPGASPWPPGLPRCWSSRSPARCWSRGAGGWRRWFAPARAGASRIHTEIARDRRRGAGSVLHDRPLDDGLDLRSSAGWSRHPGLSDRGQRRARGLACCDGARSPQTPITPSCAN